MEGAFDCVGAGIVMGVKVLVDGGAFETGEGEFDGNEEAGAGGEEDESYEWQYGEPWWLVSVSTIG